MRIITREEIVLSEKEFAAFELVEKILNGLQQEGKDPGLVREVDHMLESMYNLYDYIVKLEEV